MKKFLSFIVLIGAVYTVHCQTKEYSITSSIKDLKDSTYSMTIWNGGPQARSATGKMRDGQIFFKDTTSTALVIRLTLPTKELFKQTTGGYFPVKSQSIWMIASPGSNIQLTGYLSDFAEVYPNGDKENEIMAELNRAYHPLLNKSVNISVDIANNGDKMDSLRIKTLQTEQKEIDAKAKEVMEAFLNKHPSSVAGLYYMNDMLLRRMVSVELVESLLTKVEPALKNTGYFQAVANRVEGSRYDVGRPMFTVSTPSTYEGKAFSTEEWKGKFYLIDFWGSWCGPCIADFPALKKLKDSFPVELRVLGIASDKEASWRKGIVDHDLNWTQILNGAGDQDFVSRLNVTGFPTKILVNPTGQIVYRSSGGGESSFDKMAEIIKKWEY